ncbi:MAG: DNA-binding protein WhiA [Mogibacterium sp.]|nr:DNA-binding protein WhiA [Mogibacterium sp.]MBR2539393.1 DNA-binding protein WhiA [Mogibacterium sp.]
MSFSSDVKGELARIESKKKCCMLAEIAGFLRMSGSIKLAGGGKFGIVASTENAATARHFKMLIKEYFKSNAALSIGDSQMPGTSRKKGRNRYYLNISPEEKSMQILRETGMMLIREGDDYFSDGIYQPIVRSKCCRKSYIRGMFLSCGTVSDPRKSYHLEFVLDKERSASDLRKLIGTFVDLSANMTMRGDSYIVYVKRASYISDILGIMGADDAVLKFENIRISKGLHGDVQRMLNCDTANVDRTLSAAEEQREWIRKIQLAGLRAEGYKVDVDSDDAAGAEELQKLLESGAGLSGLAVPLREVAVLRLQRPAASLTEIGELLSPPVGKGAVSKRFAKIKAAAEKEVI